MTKEEKAEAKAHAEHLAKQWTVSQLRIAFVREYAYGREQYLEACGARETMCVLSRKNRVLFKKLYKSLIEAAKDLEPFAKGRR